MNPLKNSKLKIFGVAFSYITSGLLCWFFYEELSQNYVSSLVNFISGLLAVIVTIVILISALDNSYAFFSANFLKKYKRFYMIPISTLCFFSFYILFCIVCGHILLIFKEIPQLLLCCFTNTVYITFFAIMFI